MATKSRWLIWFLPLCFLALVIGVALRQDRDFWRSPAALGRLAQEAAARGEYLRALELARKAWSREPDNPQLGTYWGMLNLKTGQSQAALEVFRQVWARNPKHLAALTGQALALEQLGKRPDALKLLEGYLEGHPQEVEVLRCAAELAAHDPEGRDLAITYYQRLYQLEHSPQVRRELVNLLVAQGRFHEAIPLQEEEVRQYPENQEALHLLALLHYWQQDYQAATQVYQRLLERAAHDAALRYEAAQAADAARDVDQALAHYLWLYGRHQGKREYALALARLWSRKGNHAEAAGVLEPLMAEKPEVEVQRWYALELLLLGDFGKSLKAYEAAWEAGDTHKETIINLARFYGQSRHFAKAAAFWDEAARRQLLDGDLRWEAAVTYAYAQLFGTALEVLKPLQRRNPKDPRLLLFSGQLHFYQKHWDQAAHYFTAYLEQHPQDVEVRRQLAEVLSFSPETQDAALSQYGEALKLKDDIRLRLRRISLHLKARRWEAAARELQDCPVPQEPQLLREQAHLYLWLGDLHGALKHYDLFLKQVPQDPVGRLDKARVLSYLGRAPEALEILNRLRLDLPQDHAVRVAAIQAYLSSRDIAKALTLAQKELEPLPDLSLEERALLARCYAHDKDPKSLSRAMELLLQNLRHDRHHHPSLLILASLLPRLPRYEDLDRIMNRIPGIRVGGPEYAAALAYFDGKLGRQGGKLDYLLHVLNEYRRHRHPESPGELLGLAWLAMELGERHTAAFYYRRALELRPNDQGTAQLLVQCQLAQKDWGQALAALKQQGQNPGTALEMAKIYLMRGQFEGVKAMVAQIPEGHPEQDAALLLLAQAYRREGNYPEALKTLAQMQGKMPRTEWLMEKGRTLEAMGDRGAIALYEEIIKSQPDAQLARVARARQARARGHWAAAHQAYAQALETTPQDVELLNELEQVRQQMRPQLASRGFPSSRGERRPEEAIRPWQFSRFGRDREPLGLGLSNLLPSVLVDVIPILQPESLGFTDSNKLYGGIFRLSGGFWITKVLPAQLGVEYREYNQNKRSTWFTTNVSQNLVENTTDTASRLRRGEVSLGLGPLELGDRLKISGEIIGRRYWKRVDFSSVTKGVRTVYTPAVFTPGFTEFIPFPIPHFITHPDQTTPAQTSYFDFVQFQGTTQKEDRSRIMGSLGLSFPVGQKTEATLKYSRRDVFDQEAHLYPRLYQGVLDLEKVRLTSLHQAELSYNHQFRPGLDWRGNLGGAFFSDQNRRLTLYQGLAWQALREPRMHLELTPHYYLASYRQGHEAYFSPHVYHAFGLGLDFDRQIFRLPTLILQGTVQAVGQHGQWGPALQGLAALEWEFVQNFHTDLHVFFFREFVDQYRLLTAGVSFRWHF